MRGQEAGYPRRFSQPTPGRKRPLPDRLEKQMNLQRLIEGARSKGREIVSGLVYDLIANPNFTYVIIKATEAALPIKAALDKSLPFAYKSMNLASSADFGNLTTKVNKLSKNLDNLDSRIEELGKSIGKLSKKAAN